MRGRLIWGPTMTKRSTTDLTQWLAPFLARLGDKARGRMCPLYVEGPVGPRDRKNVEAVGASRWRHAWRRETTTSCITSSPAASGTRGRWKKNSLFRPTG